MAFNKPLPKWEGQITEPPESKKEEGYNAGDRPPASWENWLRNLTYEALKELQEKAGSKDILENHSDRHEQGGDDEINLEDLQGESAELKSHKAEKASEENLGHVRVDGTTIQMDENGTISHFGKVPYYWRGNELNDVTGGWIEGESDVAGEQEKLNGSLFVKAIDESGRRAYITNNAIDLSDIKKLNALIAQSDALMSGDSKDRRFVLIVRDSQDNEMASTEFFKNGDNLVMSVDVSSLLGDYYIEVLQTHRGSATGESETNIYKVWGEK